MKFEEIKILHCRRQDNKIADTMAKYCITHEDPQICNRVAKIFQHVPSYCVETYLEECISNDNMVCSQELYDTTI